jgi:hypothetical protein
LKNGDGIRRTVVKEIKGIKHIKASFGTKQVKYGGYAALITLAVIVGLILLNLITGQFSLQVDMTANRLFSLSDQSLQVLDQIKAPVNIYGLWNPGEENTDITEVIDLYLARNGNIHLQSIDPDKNPGFVAKYDRDKKGISRGSVIVEGAKGFRVIPPSDMYDVSYSNNRSNVTGVAAERRLTSALLYVGTGETPSVYEITGHEETPLANVAMKDTVERENYTLNQLNLVQSGIPSDASALILNAPRSDLSRGEADKILSYLESGGRFLVLADYRMTELPVLNDVLASYGIRLDRGIVIENDPSYTAGQVFIEVPDLLEHDITKPLTEKEVPVALPYAMGVSELSTKRRTVKLFPFLVSSKNSWLRTDLNEGSATRVSSDQQGPITVGMAVLDPEYIQGAEKQTRIAVIASGALLEPINVFQQLPGNLDLFMNSLTWLEDRPEALSVRSKSLFLLPLRLNGLQMIIFGGIFILIIPLAFFISGLVIWLKRRHL